jgi:multidrug transporter EmrE-like cation transporter
MRTRELAPLRRGFLWFFDSRFAWTKRLEEADMTSVTTSAGQKKSALLPFRNVGARMVAMAISLRSALAYATWGAIGLVLGFIAGTYAGTGDRSLRNEIALQIVRGGGGNLNEIKQKVDYLCKSGFIDAEKNSWRRRWFDISTPCDNPTGK